MSAYYVAQYKHNGKWLDIIASNRDTAKAAYDVAIERWPNKTKRPQIRIFMFKAKEAKP